MRILFVYTNINGFHDDTYSFGLASVMSYAKSFGHQASFVQVQETSDYTRVYDEVKAFDPQIVGFTAVSSQFHVVKEIAAGIKEFAPETVTVCGGVHPTIHPQCAMEAPSLDGIFIGESEEAFRDFAGLMERNESYLECKNFAYVKDGKLVRNPMYPLVKDLDVLPYADRETYAYGDTISGTGSAKFIFARGCPYNCSYCSNQALANVYDMFNNLPRYRSPESSIREIEEVVAKYDGIKRIVIEDDNFSLNKKWRSEFLQKYKERIKPKGLKFVCLLRVEVLNETFAKELSESGCGDICFGIESGNDYIRKVMMNRGMDDAQIIKAFGLADKYGINTVAINIIGVPGETDEMLWDTINLNRKINPTVSAVNIFYPYKGTELGDKCFTEGLVDEELYGTFSAERRATVLNYPEEQKEKLVYYHQNWFNLVYHRRLDRRLSRFAVQRFSGTPVWPVLRASYRSANRVRNELKALGRGTGQLRHLIQRKKGGSGTVSKVNLLVEDPINK